MVTQKNKSSRATASSSKSTTKRSAKTTTPKKSTSKTTSRTTGKTSGKTARSSASARASSRNAASKRPAANTRNASVTTKSVWDFGSDSRNKSNRNIDEDNNAHHKAFYQLFVKELQKLHDAEIQLIEIFPQVIKSASSPDLKKAFQQHARETKAQAQRIEKICAQIKEDAFDEASEAMRGLIEEVNQVLRQPTSLVKDAALIAGAQNIEHFEIASYGTVRAFAKLLDLDDAADLLKESLDEESDADKALTDIAEGGIFTAGVNQRALKY